MARCWFRSRCMGVLVAMVAVLLHQHGAWALGDDDAGTHSAPVQDVPHDHRFCSHLADNYLNAHSREAIPYTGKEMVYFLHIPRTAGRTLQSCFLKRGTPPEKRCPKAYDHLRLNVSEVPDCRLLSSHDDFSVVSLLHTDVSVLSHFRDPVDRFISAYEFAVEVASKGSLRPDDMPRPPKNPDMQSIDDIWPWSYLVPFFVADVKARRARLTAEMEAQGGFTNAWIHVLHPDGDEYYYNRAKDLSKWTLSESEMATLLPPLEPYNNNLVMSLAEFVSHPVAKDLLHNGQVFQVLGITNYSHWSEANDMRACVWGDGPSGEQLLRHALSRVDRFFHVGDTAKLNDSVVAAGAALGFSLDSMSFLEPRKLRPDPRAGAAGDGAGGAISGRGLVELARGVHRAQSNLERLMTSDERDPVPLEHKRQVQSAREQLRRSQELLQHARRGADSADVRASMAAEAGTDGTPSSSTGGESDSEGSTTDSSAEATEGLSVARKGGAVALGPALGLDYVQCARRAQDESNSRRESSLGRLAVPADARWVRFSKAARAKIPDEVINVVRQLNKLDAALHARADKLLDERRAQYAAAGKLETLPPAPDATAGRPGPPKRDRPFPIPKPKEARHQEEL